jgi:hypothetical protein
MNSINIKPIPITKKSCLLIKEGIGIFKPTYLFMNLEMVDKGHIPHAKRAAKRYVTNKRGMAICQQRMSTMLFPPIKTSGCTKKK